MNMDKIEHHLITRRQFIKRDKIGLDTILQHGPSPISCRAQIKFSCLKISLFGWKIFYNIATWEARASQFQVFAGASCTVFAHKSEYIKNISEMIAKINQSNYQSNWQNSDSTSWDVGSLRHLLFAFACATDVL